MTQEFQHNYVSRTKRKKDSPLKLVAKVLSILFSIAVVGGMGYGGYLLSQNMFSQENKATSSVLISAPALGSSVLSESAVSSAPSKSDSNASSALLDSSASLTSSSDSSSSDSQSSSLEVPDGFPVPLIAECSGVLIHSPVHPKDLEGVLFHQASFETALVMTTQLESGDVEAMEINPDYRIAETQPTGDGWLDALALHLWRADTSTEMDTSIDVGAEAGTQVYAPVTGTVILVSTYRLYDVCDDYEIHIQPEGRSDLDVVEIHVDKVSVKAGDKVVGGVTPIAVVRDLAAEDITDIQLAYYTKEGHGNHTHVQINDANYPEYRETRLKDAFEVK